MSPHSLLPLVAFFLNVTLAGLSLLRNPGSRLNRVFAYFASAMALWNIGAFMLRLPRALAHSGDDPAGGLGWRSLNQREEECRGYHSMPPSGLIMRVWEWVGRGATECGPWRAAR